MTCKYNDTAALFSPVYYIFWFTKNVSSQEHRFKTSGESTFCSERHNMGVAIFKSAILLIDKTMHIYWLGNEIILFKFGIFMLVFHWVNARKVSLVDCNVNTAKQVPQNSLSQIPISSNHSYPLIRCPTRKIVSNGGNI